MLRKHENKVTYYFGKSEENIDLSCIYLAVHTFNSFLASLGRNQVTSQVGLPKRPKNLVWTISTKQTTGGGPVVYLVISVWYPNPEYGVVLY